MKISCLYLVDSRTFFLKILLYFAVLSRDTEIINVIFSKSSDGCEKMFYFKIYLAGSASRHNAANPFKSCYY